MARKRQISTEFIINANISMLLFGVVATIIAAFKTDMDVALSIVNGVTILAIIASGAFMFLSNFHSILNRCVVLPALYVCGFCYALLGLKAYILYVVYLIIIKVIGTVISTSTKKLH